MTVMRANMISRNVYQIIQNAILSEGIAQKTNQVKHVKATTIKGGEKKLSSHDNINAKARDTTTLSRRNN